MVPMPVVVNRLPLMVMLASASMVSGVGWPSSSSLVILHVPCSCSRSSFIALSFTQMCWLGSLDFFHHQVVEQRRALSTEIETDATIGKRVVIDSADQRF